MMTGAVMTAVAPAAGIDWTSVINTFLMILAPVLIEMATGILRGASAWLKAHSAKSWKLTFAADVAEIMSASMQEEAEALKKDFEDGKLTQDEWNTHKTRLKDSAVKKVVDRLKVYPKEHAEEYGNRASDAVESWLNQNKQANKLIELMSSGNNTPSPADLNAVKVAVEAQSPDKILKQ